LEQHIGTDAGAVFTSFPTIAVDVVSMKGGLGLECSTNNNEMTAIVAAPITIAMRTQVFNDVSLYAF
jgi:hypothetical protein